MEETSSKDKQKLPCLLLIRWGKRPYVVDLYWSSATNFIMIRETKFQLF
uniref:Uncharacterized protein n=1 Tax=Arundo donax TaxID=35708 RepID=A0A0A9A2N3_ARUDO